MRHQFQVSNQELPASRVNVGRGTNTTPINDTRAKANKPNAFSGSSKTAKVDAWCAQMNSGGLQLPQVQGLRRRACTCLALVVHPPMGSVGCFLCAFADFLCSSLSNMVLSSLMMMLLRVETWHASLDSAATWLRIEGELLYTTIIIVYTFNGYIYTIIVVCDLFARA